MTPAIPPMPLPAAGSSIYIPSSGSGEHRVTGGKALVKEVKHYTQSIFIRILIPPTDHEILYEWESLSRKQKKLKQKFRETRAHIGLFEVNGPH